MIQDWLRRSLRVALTADPELPVPPVLYGGIERVVDILARGLTNLGHEVTLFAHRDSICPINRVAWPGKQSGNLLDTLRNTSTLASRVAAGHFDIVHSFSRLAYLWPILPFRVPKLMTYQREISPATTAKAVRLSRGSLEFTAISRHMIEAVPLAGRWHLVPNGVSLETYRVRSEVAQDAPLVFLGRVEEIKGPHLAIEVARRAGRRLVIAGNIPAEHRGWFEINVAPHLDDGQVNYVGAVNDQQKNELLGEAAALLMPILWDEPFGIVMVEAMACGTPVLGTPVGAIPEILRQVDPILVADGTDGRSLARGLEAVLARIQEPAEYERLAAKGRRVIEQRYTWTRHCADLSTVLGGEVSLTRAA